MSASSSSADALASAQTELAAAQKERAALTAQLRSLRYAVDLTGAELSRRTSSPPLSPATSPRAIPPSPHVLEADLLAAKAAATAARQRVHALEAEASALRRRSPPARRASRARRALSPLSPMRRSASRRAIAQFDALVAPENGDGELLPCHVSVSAACALSISAVDDGTTVSADADSRVGHASECGVGRISSPGGPRGGGTILLALEPPFLRLSEVAPLVGEAGEGLPTGFAEWISSLAVRAWPPSNPMQSPPTEPVPMLLCGISEALRDAQAMVLQHNASPFGTNFSAAQRVHSLNAGPGLDEGAGPALEPGLLTEGRERIATVAAESVSTARTIASKLTSRLGAFGFGGLGGLGGLGASLADADNSPAGNDRPSAGRGKVLAGKDKALTAEDDVSKGEAKTLPIDVPENVGNGSDVDSESPASTPRSRRRRRLSLPGDGPGTVQMLGGTSAIISPALATAVMSAVPSRYTDCSLSLLYSTRVHGISLLSLYAKCAGHSPTILAFRDSGGARFGCFATAPWVKRTKQTYYGTGESFCWQAAPVSSNSSSGGAGDGKGSVSIHNWSRRNKYFQFSSSKYLAFGGGGHFAIRIDDELQKGSSGQCETYNSPCLASDVDFDCVVLEAWALRRASKLSRSSIDLPINRSH